MTMAALRANRTSEGGGRRGSGRHVFVLSRTVREYKTVQLQKG